MLLIFLSTPSARRATNYLAGPIGDFLISIHALREEGDEDLIEPEAVERKISIHALREEGDVITGRYGDMEQISIHALREEGDVIHGLIFTRLTYFYPRPPRGGRRNGTV